MQIRPLNLRKALLEENDPGALGMIPMLPPIIDVYCDRQENRMKPPPITRLVIVGEDGSQTELWADEWIPFLQDADMTLKIFQKGHGKGPEAARKADLARELAELANRDA